MPAVEKTNAPTEAGACRVNNQAMPCAFADRQDRGLLEAKVAAARYFELVLGIGASRSRYLTTGISCQVPDSVWLGS